LTAAEERFFKIVLRILDVISLKDGKTCLLIYSPNNEKAMSFSSMLHRALTIFSSG